MGKEFNPEAIKEKLAEIKEQEEVETFTCSGCLTDTAGLMFQDKLCKSCALELIAYSRKAQNHIDSLRPIYKTVSDVVQLAAVTGVLCGVSAITI